MKPKWHKVIARSLLQRLMGALMVLSNCKTVKLIGLITNLLIRGLRLSIKWSRHRFPSIILSWWSFETKIGLGQRVYLPISPIQLHMTTISIARSYLNNCLMLLLLQHNKLLWCHKIVMSVGNFRTNTERFEDQLYGCNVNGNLLYASFRFNAASKSSVGALNYRKQTIALYSTIN